MLNVIGSVTDKALKLFESNNNYALRRKNDSFFLLKINTNRNYLTEKYELLEESAHFQILLVNYDISFRSLRQEIPRLKSAINNK